MRHGYASFLLAHCLRRFNGERTLAAVYHLFSGKKSAQTLQDSKWFQLEPLFGTWKNVTMARSRRRQWRLSNSDSLYPRNSGHTR
nr:hypothetical protein [Geobacillus thermoleovorans]